MNFSLLANDWENATAKIRKRTTFQKQTSDKKLFKILTSSLLVTTLAFTQYTLFVFYVTPTNDCYLLVFHSTLFTFGMGRSRTHAASKIEPFVTKAKSFMSLLSLERASLIYIYVYIKFLCCFTSQKRSSSNFLGDSLTNLILITAFYRILAITQMSPGASQ